MTMLSAASPNAQLMAVMIKQARAAHWLRSAHVYDDNAIGGIVENTAHGCDDKQARAAQWLRSARVHDGNAVDGVAERTAHDCDDQASLRGALAAVRASTQ